MRNGSPVKGGRLYLLVVRSNDEDLPHLQTRSRVGGAGSSQALRPTILLERTADAQFASGDVACSAARRGVDAPPTGGVGRARCGTAKRLLWFTRLGSRRRKRRAASIFSKSSRLSDQRFSRPFGHSRRPCRCEWQVPARLERRVGALRLRAAISRQGAALLVIPHTRGRECKWPNPSQCRSIP
jgi:hypothetical protein